MLVSVVIPCFNQGHFLSEAIESVLGQTYPQDKIEIVVVDDGSTDNTVEIAMKYPVSLISQNNQGLPMARNNGISKSNGNFILPLDADDTIHPTFLELTSESMNQYPNVGVVYTHRQHFGNVISIKYAEHFDTEKLKKKSFLNYCSLFRKDVWVACGGYNPHMTLGYEDWDFWLSVAETDWEFFLIEEVLFNYRKHAPSLSDIAKANHDSLYEILKQRHPSLFNT